MDKEKNYNIISQQKKTENKRGKDRNEINA
jgi:hypothetical protein